MIRLFIYQTYNYYKLDKKNQSIHKDTLKFRKVDAVISLKQKYTNISTDVLSKTRKWFHLLLMPLLIQKSGIL